MKPFEPKQNKLTPGKRSSENEFADLDEASEEVSGRTKFKIMMAVGLIAFAGYVAYWVQQPTTLSPQDLRSDIFGSDLSASNDGNTDSGLFAASDSNANTSENSINTLMADANATEQNTEETVAATVEMKDLAFVPVRVNIKPGDKVKWVNNDSVDHLVTGANFTSGNLRPDESFVYQFNAEGEFEYICSYHEEMKGSVMVSASTPEPGSFEDPNNANTSKLVTFSMQLDPNNVNNQLKNAAYEDGSTMENAGTTSEESELDTNKNAGDLDAQPVVKNTNSKTKTRRLATTGPEDSLYLVLGLGVGYYIYRRFRPKNRIQFND